MTQTARVYKIEMLIRSRGLVSFQTLLDELEVSAATLKRDLAYLRDQLDAPIEYDRFSNGYRFSESFRGRKHELPGLWFNERELYALLTTNQLLSELDPHGFLSRHVEPLLERIHHLLGAAASDAAVLLKRVKIAKPATRPVTSQFFELVGESLLKRKRLQMRYLTRWRNEVSDRLVSPQRLVYYRNTWYLDAWCHERDRLLRFALDSIEAASIDDRNAKDVPLRQVEAEMDAGYGIYAASDRQWAVLRFTPRAAQWVSHEQWHAEQRSRWLDDGAYELEVPYGEVTEIGMDILRHGDQVKVMAPTALANRVREALLNAASQYASAPAHEGKAG